MSDQRIVHSPRSERPVLPDYDEALTLALCGISVLPTEPVDLACAHRRVLREEVVADRDLPPFDRAQMDGYALRASDLGRIDAFPVIATIAAGRRAANLRVAPGQCVAIATGAPLPDGLDTVIQHELSDRGDQHGDPVRFTIDTIAPATAVHPRGADAKAGQRLMQAGTLLSPRHVGIAAMVGRTQLAVSRQPRVVLLTSGDEVLSADQPVAAHQIRNSNQPMLAALLDCFGAAIEARLHLPDQLEPTLAAVGEALNHADLLVTVGGVSAGDRDHFPAAFDHHSIERLLHGAAIQPGRPIFVGRAPTGTMIVGLPGNPVSSLACACLFLWPIVRTMLGLPPELPWRNVVLASPVKPNPKRRAFRPAILAREGATVPPWAGSGDLVHTAPTHGLLELPVQVDDVPAGSRLRFLPWPS